MPTSLPRRVLILLAPIALLAACGDDGDDPAAEEQTEDASVSFVSPSDGDHVAGGVVVEMAADGLVDRAGRRGPRRGRPLPRDRRRRVRGSGCRRGQGRRPRALRQGPDRGHDLPRPRSARAVPAAR